MSSHHGHSFDSRDGLGIVALVVLMALGMLTARVAAGLLIALGEYMLG